MDICAEIRILFNQQSVRYLGVMNEYQDKQKSCLGLAIEG